MQAVGQPELSDSLIGALSQTPRIPQEVITSLYQGPSQIQQLGQAAAGGVAFMRGQPNPVTPILEQQRRERVGMATLMQQMNYRADLADHRKSLIDLQREKMAEKKQADEEKLLRLSVKSSWDIINNPHATPMGVAMAQDNIRRDSAKLFKGYQLPEVFIQKSVTTDQIKAFLQDGILTATMTEDPKTKARMYTWTPEAAAMTQRRHPYIPQAEAMQTLESLNKEDVQKMLNLGTNEERLTKAVDLQSKQYDLAAKMMVPYGWSHDKSHIRGLVAFWSTVYPDKPLTEATQKEQNAVSLAYDQFIRQNKLDDQGVLIEQRFQNALTLLAQKGDQQMAAILARVTQAQQGKPVPEGTQLRELLKAQGGAEAWRALQELQTTAAKVPTWAWPGGEDLLSVGIARGKRAIWGGQADLYQMKMKALSIINGLISRQVFDEKGNKALATMKDEIEGTSNLPPYKSFKGYLDSIQTLVKDNLQGKIDVLESSDSNAPVLLKGLKATIRRMGQPAEPTPLKPQAKMRATFVNVSDESNPKFPIGSKRTGTFTPGVDKVDEGWVLIEE